MVSPWHMMVSVPYILNRGDQVSHSIIAAKICHVSNSSRYPCLVHTMNGFDQLPRRLPSLTIMQPPGPPAPFLRAEERREKALITLA